MIGAALTQALKLQRDTLNRKFRAAKQTYRLLEDDAFSAFLRNTLDPIATAVAAQRPDLLLEVVDTLYDMALPLVGQGWLGAESRAPALEAGWRKLLTGLTPWLCQSPRNLSGALLNALYQLHEAGEPVLDAWVGDMIALTPHYTQLQDVFATGRLLAWRHGLASHRAAALEAGQSLPSRMSQLALRLAAPLTAEHWERMRQQSQAMPEECLTDIGQSPAWMGWVGGFSGFGSHFARPPLLMSHASGIHVTDGRKVWRITADGYGAQLIFTPTLQPWNHDPQPSATISASGMISVDSETAQFASFPAPRQASWHDGLLAVTSKVTHRIGLIRWNGKQA